MVLMPQTAYTQTNLMQLVDMFVTDNTDYVDPMHNTILSANHGVSLGILDFVTEDINWVTEYSVHLGKTASDVEFFHALSEVANARQPVLDAVDAARSELPAHPEIARDHVDEALQYMSTLPSAWVERSRCALTMLRTLLTNSISSSAGRRASS